MDALIAGAGVGGLTTALMLYQRGIRCRIFERTPEMRELGVGINTLPHAIGELASLGLLERLDAVALRTRELRYLTKHGQEVWRELRGTYAGHDMPQFSIHRGRLQKVLYDAVVERLGADAVQTGAQLSGFMQDEGGVTAQLRRQHRWGAQPNRPRRNPRLCGRHTQCRAAHHVSRRGCAKLERCPHVAWRDRMARLGRW